MPIAVLLGDGPVPWVERVAPTPVTPARAMAILGYHDLEELADIADQLPGKRAAGLFDADAATIKATGAAVVGQAAVDHVAAVADHLWLHIDLDVLDQDVFPATDYLISGGLDWDQLVALVTPVARDPRLAGWSLSCYNPEKDPGGRDGRAIVGAMERIFRG
jgi:arginase